MQFLFLFLCVFLYYPLILSSGETIISVTIEPRSLLLQLDETGEVKIQLSQPAPHAVSLEFTYQNADGQSVELNDTNRPVIAPLDSFSIAKGEKGPVTRGLRPLNPGLLHVGLNETSIPRVLDDLNRTTCYVSALHLRWLDVLQVVIGWIYFAAWTVSFYPQVFLNWKRKSVVGFNFDFLCFNIVGFFTYSLFNVALYAIPEVQAEYFRIHPLGVIPVLLNDILFSVHALAISLITVVQVFLYERGGQRVSRVCIGIITVMAIYSLTNLFLAVGKVISWLTFLYNVSYVKLVVTLIKYIPQAVMNCRRRSTVGWSIGNILLDFTGGFLSILQLIIISYNYDSWTSVFGSPTKFGLGAFSMAFDVLFMVQHWCFFRHPQSSETWHILGPDQVDDEIDALGSDIGTVVSQLPSAQRELVPTTPVHG